jgi:hypothetical protein
VRGQASKKKPNAHEINEGPLGASETLIEIAIGRLLLCRLSRVG